MKLEWQQTCIVCNKDKPASEFAKHNYGSGLVVGHVCFQCQSFGRKSLKELAERKHAGGRPKLDLPIQKIKELHEQGHGYKSITRILNEQGFKTSTATIRRMLINS